MEVKDEHVEGAILELMARMNVGYGGRITHGALEKEWRTTGLRRSDLLAGIDLLIRLGHLQRDERFSEDMTYCLTEDGRKRMAQDNSLLGTMFGGHARLLRKAQKRRRRQTGNRVWQGEERRQLG